MQKSMMNFTGLSALGSFVMGNGLKGPLILALGLGLTRMAQSCLCFLAFDFLLQVGLGPFLCN